MKLLLTLFLSLIVSQCLLAQTNVPVIKPVTTAAEADSVTFMKWVRRTPLQESWAAMSGKISHRRRGKPAIEQPIYMGSIFTSKRAYLQFNIGEKESYTVSQAFSELHPKSVVTPNLPDSQQQLPLYGVRADDMTLSFIYWILKNELKSESIKLQTCRVLELEEPATGERVRIWVTIEHGFPIKAQWFKKGENERYRSLEITSFAKQDNDLWVPTEFTLEGPGWRTLLSFTDRKAGLGKTDMPEDLFKENQ